MLAQAANDMSGQLRGLITELQQAGLQITNSSTQVLATAEDHALGSVQQAASIAQVTSTMEELTNTAKQIAQSATSVERIADDSADAAHAGYDSVGEALEVDGEHPPARRRHLRQDPCCSASGRAAFRKC